MTLLRELTPKLIWDNDKQRIAMSANGYMVFDDTVMDKRSKLGQRLKLPKRPKPLITLS